MSKAQLVITAVVLEGRSKSEVARDYDVSPLLGTATGQTLRNRRRRGVRTALAPPPPQSPGGRHRVEDTIVRLRKTLDKQGFDAGAATIAEHLTRDRAVTKVPAISTIWRILKRRGFVTPQPQKRPRSAWKRFQADLPNQCWQADVTHWHLADHTEVEILDIIDDHSRLAIASHARPVTTGPDVVDTFTAAFARWGTPAGVLTDNGAIFTAKQRGHGRTALEITLGELGIKYSQLTALSSADLRQSRALPPNTEKHLRAIPTAATLAELQHQIDEFLAYYNDIRPHRALRPPHTPSRVQRPAQSLPQRLPDRAALPRAPRHHRRRRRHHHPPQQPPAPHRLKQATPRHQSHRAHRRPRHPRPAPRHRNAHPQSDPRPDPRLPTTRRQMRKLARKQALDVNDVSGHLSTMSRDITSVPPAGFEPATPAVAGAWSR